MNKPSAATVRAQTELAHIQELQRLRSEVTPVRRAPARSLLDPKDMSREAAIAEASTRRSWCDHFAAGSGRTSKVIEDEFAWQTARLNALVRRIGT